MFFRILKKDLKRKKTMNLILLIFIIMSTMFMASSVKNLITVMGAVDYFTELSVVPDFLTISTIEGDTDEIAEFLDDNELVESYQEADVIQLTNEQIEIVDCQKEPGRTEYKKRNLLSLQALPKEFMKVFNMEGDSPELQSGEVAISKVEADENNLQVGDKIAVNVGDEKQEFTVKHIVKDAVFGSTMIGYKRMFVTEEDFLQFAAQEDAARVRIHGINYTDGDAFQTEFRKQDFPVITNLEKDILTMCYFMDLLVSGILIIVSICLILIAFLILRFTILFTLQEDYREIGIMKALGLRDKSIKQLYMVKYFGIAVAGALLGMILSVPFGEMLLEQATVNLLMEDGTQALWINLLCALAVVVIVILFCYSTTNRLKKFSAMEAIRNGSNGERFQAKSKISLHKMKGIPTWLYLAVNDILSNFKSFAVLAIIFCIGTLLILLPASAVSTLQSRNLVYSFSCVPSDVFLTDLEDTAYMSEDGKSKLEQETREIKEKIEDAGEACQVWAEVSYLLPSYADDPEKVYSYFTMQAIGDEQDNYQMVEGKQPMMSDEISITEKTAKEMGVGIGDTVHLKLQSGEDKEFLISGIYQTMMNMGDGFRVSQEVDLGGAAIFSMQVELADKENEEAVEAVQKIFPDRKMCGWKEFPEKLMGDVVQQLDTLQLFIILVVLCINCLITALMVKTLMTRERGDIAILKSIGFHHKTIKAWQAARIIILLVGAILVGSILSHFLAPVTVGPIFAIMGANHMQLETDLLDSLLIFPSILLIGTGICAYICAGEVRKVELKEINNVE